MGGSTFVVMTSSYSDSVFLYLVNSRHTHISSIIMREIITTIIIIGNSSKYVLGGGVTTDIKGVGDIDVSIKDYNTIDM